MYPSPGEILEGKYRIERMLGEGAMGGVFAATHVLRKAPVALKFMSAQAAALPEAVDRFMNEAIAASQIDSDHVVKIFDVGRWGQLPYLVMEFMQGRDLSNEIEAQLQTGAPMSIARAVHFTLQILRAMQVAHARGIVHRDLKPANAFVVERDGEPDFVKLLDFGISKQREAGAVHLTRTNVAMGTPLYMSPEQAKSARDADARSDVYSVAAILYELLTGRPPHEADNYNLLLFKLFQEEPKPITELRPEVPPGLAHVVHSGLCKNVEQRIQSATEFARMLGPFCDARSSSLLARMLARSGSSMGSAQYETIAAAPASFGSAATGVPHASTAVTFGTSASSPGAQPAQKSSSKAPLFIGLAALLLVGGIGGAIAMRTPTPAPAPAGAGGSTQEAKQESKVEPESEPSPMKPIPPPIHEPEPPPAETAPAPKKATAPAAKSIASAKASATAAPTATATAPTEATTPPPKKKKLDWDLSK